ncbi:cytochrome b/b6 domain-containing protein [Asticcacaulis benevestitus]|uniref:cytochrome b/b6 domain-containing protein n=1 Tax=Asticcacaulis benevestitus TaxID=347481 RepID=UPI001F008742|nr:cytochrome b/b6 domain-containing protein [Asticcacaulis benevestitus]
MKASAAVKVWDPLVRLFHWTIVGGFFLNRFVFTDNRLVHRYIGYAIVCAILMRLIWGFVGTRYARFSSFVPNLRQLLTYLGKLMRGQEPRYLSHNPAGAVMMLALVVLMLGLGVTGWMSELDAFWGAEWLENLHELLANTVLGLAVLHVVAAVIESVRHKENLIKSMITGFKRSPKGTDIDHEHTSHRG